nr:MAG TPA: hypothetical protein [Caudoviricetes sp.]
MARTIQWVEEGVEYRPDYAGFDKLAWNTISYQIIENAQRRGYVFLYICGRNLDWMNNNGFKFLSLDKISNVWEEIAGIEGGFRLRIDEPIREESDMISAVVYGGDMPQGGFRTARFLKPIDVYRLLRKMDISRERIIDWFDVDTRTSNSQEVTRQICTEIEDAESEDITNLILTRGEL